MKKRNVIILLVILAAAAAAMMILLPQGGQTRDTILQAADAESPETPGTEPEKTDADADNTAGENAEETAQEQPFLVQITDDDPSIAYVLVRIKNMAGLLPLPTEGEYTRTIRQKMDDGTEAINVLHLTTNGVWMEESNCEGHDCIYEGEVTLENREERVLWNMIICLPHQLSLELITREEALDIIHQ